MSSNDWLLWFAGGVLALYGAALQWWALLANRSFARRQCPRCWYDMSKSSGRTCPECGKAARREADLYRRRPRWGAVGLGLVMLMLAAGLFKAARDGFQTMLPDRALVWLAPLYLGGGDAGAAEGALEKELKRRLGRLSAESWRRLVERCWTPDDPFWSVDVQARDGSPAGVPVRFSASVSRRLTGWSWLDGRDLRVRLRPRHGSDGDEILLDENGEPFADDDDDDVPAATLFDPAGESREDWRLLALESPALAPGATAVEFDVVVELATAPQVPSRARSPRAGPAGARRVRRPAQPASAYTAVWSTSIAVPVAAGAPGATGVAARALPDDVTTPDYLGLRIDPYDHGHDPRSRLLVRRSCAESTSLIDGLVVPLHLELRFDGTLVATGELAWRESITLRSFDLRVPMRWRAAETDLHQVPEAERDRWSVRARTDPALALAFLGAEEHLTVEPFEIPIGWR